MATRNKNATTCGLKNSQCSDNDGEDVDDNTEDWIQRFTFVDGRRGLWSTGSVNDYPDVITCPVGGLIVFYYPQGVHDVVELPSRNDYARCNLAGAVTLSPRTISTATGQKKASSFSDVSYYYHCSQPNYTAYLTCSVPGHCFAGQKVQIYVNGSEYAYDPTRELSDPNYWRIHVNSIDRLLRLLNYRRVATGGSDASESIVVMDHGYQTEELANVTADLVWCALDHCPEAAAAAGHSSAALTQKECESILYTLLGFIQRKRPVPLWELAEEYYREALERGGSNECTAQSYLSMLFWTQRTNYTMAVQETQRLCELCHVSDPAAVRQAQIEWTALHETVPFDKTLQWDERCFADYYFSPSSPLVLGTNGSSNAPPSSPSISTTTTATVVATDQTPGPVSRIMATREPSLPPIRATTTTTTTFFPTGHVSLLPLPTSLVPASEAPSHLVERSSAPPPFFVSPGPDAMWWASLLLVVALLAVFSNGGRRV
jgi:hypothetical protein